MEPGPKAGLRESGAKAENFVRISCEPWTPASSTNGTASPVAVNGFLYFLSDRGMITVVKSGDSSEVLAQNKLGTPIFASPAIVGNALYVRTASQLWGLRRIANHL
jgi:hypothetical protein